MFRFPSSSRDVERKKVWIKNVNRLNNVGSKWEPGPNARLCHVSKVQVFYASVARKIV